MVQKCWPPGELTLMHTPQYLHHQCPCPQGEPQPCAASSVDPSRPAGRSGPGFYEVPAFALGVHKNLYAPSKRGVSVSSSPVNLLQSSPAGLQSHMLWCLLLLMPDPQVESLMWGPEFSLLWENCIHIIVLQFVGHPPAGYGI